MDVMGPGETTPKRHIKTKVSFGQNDIPGDTKVLAGESCHGFFKTVKKHKSRQWKKI